VSGSGIAKPYANLYLAQTDNHASTPPLSFFTGRMPFLLPNQQHQSTEGKIIYLASNTDNKHQANHMNICTFSAK